LEQLAQSGAALLARVVDELADGTAVARPQNGEVTLAPKLTLADGAIDFTRSGDDVANTIRGVTPEPGAFTTLDGARLKVLDAHVAREAPRLQPGQFAVEGKRVLVGTASTPIELVTVLPAGKKAMDAAAWWRGRPAGSGTVAE
jgi:methionyl-tRNA formyltransferase